MKNKIQKLLIIVGVLLLFGGISLAYFISNIMFNGSGASTNITTTANIKGATLKVEGTINFEDIDMYPGHKDVSGIKVTATGNNELIPYNLIWKGSNTLTTPLKFTVYKTSEELNVTSTCAKKTKVISGQQILSEECNISNIDKLGSIIASGTINKKDSKVTLAQDEFITALNNGLSYYYYIIIEYPNLDEEQNIDIGGSIEGEVTVEESNIKPDINIIAAYIIEDNGEYKEVEDIPESGYQVNTSKSTCSNNATASGVTPSITINNLTKSGTSCYLYFDKAPTASETILSNITVNDEIPDFSKIATEDEGMFKAEDGMYGGTSYYWRGSVTNNYVKFAGFCWRIIRINGDGSLRLIYDGSTCHANGTKTTENIAVLKQPYNLVEDNSSYVGWTSTLNSQRPTNNTDVSESNAKSQTDSWYNTNIGNNTTYASKVVDGKFCNDRNTQNNEIWTSTSGTQYYAAHKRLWEDYEPTLSCDSQDIYLLKAGAITADEAMYAGATKEVNQAYYLYNYIDYWTMTPKQCTGNRAFVFSVHLNGSVAAYNANMGTIGIRPVINLHSNITFSGGTGTQTNPYEVAD